MHLKSIIPPVYALLLSILFPSCGSIKELEYKSINDIKIEKVGFVSSTLSAELVYYNPNNFSLELSRSEMDIYLNNNFLGHSTQTYQIKIPKHGQFSLPMRIDLNMKNLLKNGLTSMFNKEVSIRAVGKIKVGKGKVSKSFPFDYTTKQNLSLFQ